MANGNIVEHWAVADDAISRLMVFIPIRQDVRIIRVELIEEAVTMAKAVTEANE
jgi:hypothetical protein